MKLERDPPRRRFLAVRVAVLLGVLAIVLLWAWNDSRRRAERTRWERSLNVALILIETGPVEPAALAAFRSRAVDLELRLDREMKRHGATHLDRPVEFHVHGPTPATGPPPTLTDPGVGAALRHTYDSWRYRRRIDSALDLPWRAFDARIYVAVRAPPAQAQLRAIEGESQHGGWVGSVSVELDETMVDFALFVATHELMHVLGAHDKYDAVGRAVVPVGLADPTRTPLYPQPGAEIMARNVVLGPGRERPPGTLKELYVGPVTAQEIGWLSR